MRDGALQSMPGMIAPVYSDGGGGWSGLLHRFYAGAGLPAPRLQKLKEAELPEPYHSLLVHSADMTPTLASYYGQTLGLTVLSREVEHGHYHREVVLYLNQDNRPVEYGVIRILVDHFPAAARDLILQEQRPLGAILESEQIPHVSWPQAFFRMKPDSRVCAFLGLAGPLHSEDARGNGAASRRMDEHLYGRRNVLLDGQRRLLAEVIEILAPAPTGSIPGR